jgi:excisionase family DNA binding protein
MESKIETADKLLSSIGLSISEYVNAKTASLLPKLYTVKEACSCLKVSHSTLYRLISYHRISTYRVGGKTMLSEPQLLSMIRSNG